MRPIAPLVLSVGMVLPSSGCASDWDALDPRVGGPSDNAGGGGAGTSTNPTGAGPGGGGSAAGGASTTSTTGGGPGQQTYPATIARCVSPVTPDPNSCELAQGGGIMAVDTANSDLNDEPTHGYLRFDLDSSFAGRTITSARLEIQVKEGDSTQSGELYEVAPFALSTLMGDVPDQMDQIARDQGPLVAGDTSVWALPEGLIQPEGRVHLGLFPLVTDGVEYASDQSNTPPLLVIEYR